MRDAAREGRRRLTRLVTNLPHVMCPSARENETEVEPQVRLAAYK